MLPEPHSTKQHEDAVEWACGTTADVMLGEVDKVLASDPTPSVRFDPEAAAAMCRRVDCPVLVINGDLDMCQPPARSRRVVELTGGELVVIEGAGHLPHARYPSRLASFRFDRFVRRVAAAMPTGVAHVE